MKTIDCVLKLEFEKFLEWEIYNKENEIRYDYYDYPNGIEIENIIRMIPNDFHISLDSINIILYFLSKDDESETIMEILEEKSILGYLVARKGIKYLDMNARWQVAVLLAYFKDTKLLIEMIENDEEEYVRRRALLGLRHLDKTSSEKLAIKHLKSPYEYERMVAIDTLNFLSSSYFNKALNILKNDTSSVVQNRINNLKY